MMGVNLKQTYARHGGVYVDYLVPGGAADRSGVVRVGDVMVRVGDTDVRRGTIVDIPQTIAKSKRPVCVVLEAGAGSGAARDGDSGGRVGSWMDPVDVAVGMSNRVREELLEAAAEAEVDAEGLPPDDGDNHSAPTDAPDDVDRRLHLAPEELRMSSSLLDAANSSLENDDESLESYDEHSGTEENDGESAPASDRGSDRGSGVYDGPAGAAVDPVRDGGASLDAAPCSDDGTAEASESGSMGEGAPAAVLLEPPPEGGALLTRSQLARYASLRCNEEIPAALRSEASTALIRAALANDGEEINRALQEALLLCCVDGRRLLFLSRFLAEGGEDSTYGVGRGR